MGIFWFWIPGGSMCGVQLEKVPSARMKLVLRVMITRLGEVVRHRRLILPQLGAPGVAAHEVKKRTGFWVEYGPVRASDLTEYLKDHQATAEMRQVRFTLRDRLVLIPVDVIRLLVAHGCRGSCPVFCGGTRAESGGDCSCPGRDCPLSHSFTLAANPQLQHKRIHPGRIGRPAVQPVSIPGAPWLDVVAARRTGVGAPPGHAGRDRFHCAQFYRFNHLYFTQRCEAGNVPVHSSDGLDLWDRHPSYGFFLHWSIDGDK